MSRTSVTLLLTVLSTLTVGGSLAAQQDSGEPSVKQLLLKIERLENRVDELETEHALDDSTVLETHINSLSDALASPRAANDFNPYWKHMLRFDNEDKTFRLRIGGRMQTDFIWGAQNDDDEDATNFQGLNLGDLRDGTEFRRARFFMQGQIYENTIYKLEVNFTDGRVDLNDVWIGLKNVPWAGTVIAGHHKQPFSLEYMASGKHITFMERSLIDVFAPQRDSGIRMARTFGDDDRIHFSAGLYIEANSRGNTNLLTNQDGKYNGAVRITGLPIAEDDNSTILHVGFAFSYRNPNSDTIRFAPRPEINIFPVRPLTTAFLTDADNVYTFGAELLLIIERFSVQAEAMYVYVDSETFDDPEFWGFYAYASYFLTPDRREYSRTAAIPTRVLPTTIAHDGEPGGGAVEVALRFSYIDLDEKRVAGGTGYAVTAGVTWYLNPNAQILLNYIYGNYDDLGLTQDEGETHVIGLRFQIHF